MSSDKCCTQCYGTAESCSAGGKICYDDDRSQGINCRKAFNSTCVSIDPKDYYNIWSSSTGFCETMITNNLLVGDEGVQWANSQMYDVFLNLYKDANNGMRFITVTNSTGPPSLLQFQNYVQGVCLRNAGACSSALQSLCAQYTRDDLLIYPGLIQMCGCNLPQEEYSKYENLYGLPKPCDPICARTDVVPATQLTGQPQKCSGTICIIDDINVNITDSRTGNFNFEQSCGGCYGNVSCECIVSGVSLTVVNSKIGDTVLSENCAGSVDCYQQNPYDPTAPAIKVDCNLNDTNTVTTKDVYTEKYSQTSSIGITYSYLLIIIVIIFFFIVVCFWALILKIDDRADKVVVTNNKDKKVIEIKL